MQQPAETTFESVGIAELAQAPEWWKIYTDSFPPEEREPATVILDSLATGAGLAFRARRGGATVAIATTHLLLRPAAVFLVYLAVESGSRGAGTGGRLFQYAGAVSARRMSESGVEPLGIIWEVDLPDRSAADDCHRRRISFFERHGGVLLPSPYRQPPVNGSESVAMRLMFRPAAGIMPDSATIQALIRAMYFEKYGGVNRIAAEALERLYTFT